MTAPFRKQEKLRWVAQTIERDELPFVNIEAYLCTSFPYYVNHAEGRLVR